MRTYRGKVGTAGTGNTGTRILAIVCLLLFAGFARPLIANPYTWQGTVNSNWFEPNNWDPAAVPGPGADVVVDGTILLTNETAELASFTMTGGSMTFSNWTTRLRAGDVDLQGGVLTLPAAYLNNAMSNRVWIACQDFTLAENAMIDADEKGFLGSHGEGGASTLVRRGGGSHGGRGGRGDIGGSVDPYGSVHEPVLPGSGGAGGTSGGGAGGGAVFIQAGGTANLQGIVSANGQNNIHGHGGGGSGGSIFVECDTFAGSVAGLLRANGGDGGSHGGGGGGGRIAVAYNGLQGDPGVRYSTAPGAGWGDASARINTHGWFYGSGWGTLSLSDAASIAATPASDRFDRVHLYFRELADLTVANFTVTDNRFIFATPGLEMTVTGNLNIGANAEFGVGEIFGDANSTLSVGNDLSVTDGGVFAVYSGLAVGALDDFGARVSVGNAFFVDASSWVHPYSHPTNGGSVRFITDTLTVEADGGFNAFARGYAGTEGPSPGANLTSRGSGAGHGGRGGASDTGVLGGGVTGLLERTVRPGSGSRAPDVFGGGLIYIEAGTASISGTLNADGAEGNHAGGSAGGGIVIDCVNLSGQSPLFHADGGDGSSSLGGGGGGGRIALHYQNISGLDTPRFHTRAGSGPHDNAEYVGWHLKSEHGTAWFSTPELLSEVIDGERFAGVRFHANGFDSWTVSSLTISNCFLIFGEDGFELNVEGDLVVGDGGLLGIGAISGAEKPVLNCGGNLTVRAGGALKIYAGAVSDTVVEPGAEVQVAGVMTVETGGWVYPYSHVMTAGNGGSPRFQARSLTVATNAGFKAIGLGYRFGQGPGPGAGGTSGRGAGGGHGGKGGNHSTSGTSGGITNGLALAPVLPGSGAARAPGGSGGGVIWLEIEKTALLDGLLNADGADRGASNDGGGAGGSILVSAEDVRASSNSVLQARGGTGHSSHGGGGGGGRIAVWRRVPAHERDALLIGDEVARLQERITGIGEPFSRFAGVTLVDEGPGWDDGEPGTVRFIDGTPTGTVIFLR